MKRLLLLVCLLLSGQARAQVATISVYGDSFVYRSNWNCDGLGLTVAQCNDLKADSSFVTYMEQPYSWNTTPWIDVVGMDGRGGSSCLPHGSDPGLAARLDYQGETFVGVMIGINDVNLYGTSVAATVTCLKQVWTVIAEDFGARPIAFRYPEISGTVWPVSVSTAQANRQALNAAIITAASEFNNGRPWYQQVVLASVPGHDPTTNTSDGVHPNPDGALLFAKYFFWTFN